MSAQAPAAAQRVALPAGTPTRPRALLVAVGIGRIRLHDGDLDELAALAATAGFDDAGRVIAHRPRPDPALYVGSGKVDEIAAMARAAGATSVVFDVAVSPAQHRNLEIRLGLAVADRTDLILSIFAQRARSHEGKLQVELARCEHSMSRLKRAWSHLERQQGGLGVRGGPGEKQIELDRRMLENRIRRLRADLARVEKQHRVRRRSRERSGVPTVSLVGYTNAGKSTLFNALTGAQTLAEDKLFATLDTLTRRVRLPSGQVFVLSDTVGFIRELPHALIAAFRATLEETVGADLLLHVIDASSPERDTMIASVDAVLAEIGADAIPQLRVFNKIDACGRSAGIERGPCGSIETVYVSAATGAGLDGLREALGQRLFIAPHVDTQTVEMPVDPHRDSSRGADGSGPQPGAGSGPDGSDLGSASAVPDRADAATSSGTSPAGADSPGSPAATDASRWRSVA